ncbi:MAG: nodulation protein NfeD, partial [Candidatus Marinimicrobia bacterium]|nr:nodulation protein NfeD [Candidatus Neomarinimicrobiota bacterium]
MKSLRVLIATFAVLVLVGGTEAKDIWVLKLQGVINPVASRYITSYLKKADTTRVECLILELDTPGGLMNSMRDIIKAFLNSEIPIIVYISPRGAQAASAGVFITIAAHIAAMSPGTNIGAAHPVSIGGGGIFGGRQDSSSTKTMMEKVTNDAVAFIKAIARERGRNEEWVEEAVRKSVSITETEALKENVIDLVAGNLNELIAKIDGKKVKTPTREVRLNTRNARVVMKPMGLHFRILNAISDPNIAYLLLILGFYGLFFELSNP